MAHCRYCKSELSESFVDLGVSPVSNAFLDETTRWKPEVFYPLATFVCSRCYLVQALDIESAEHHFNDNYIYFSSFSEEWVAHARRFAEAMVDSRRLDSKTQVVEIASNDGYLLQHFAKFQIPVLGVEPSANVARVAEGKGIPTVVRFFSQETARLLVEQGQAADLIVANNVLAHVPDIGDFVMGFKTLLKPEGVVSIEFPWLLNLIEKRQFDTIYHEHYSYLSLIFLKKIMAKSGLEIFHVEEHPTHGGSLRVFLKHTGQTSDPVRGTVAEFVDREIRAGLDKIQTYQNFTSQVAKVKFDLLEFLIQAKRDGKTVVGYGAPAKGNTLLNYCGVGREFLDFTVDRSPHKQGKLLPGTRIPVFAVEKIAETKPDYILILPWNLKNEIMGQLKEARSWGARFVVPIPNLEVLD